MEIDITKLPDDVDALKRLVTNLYARHTGILKTKDQRIDNLEFRVHQLDETLKKYLSRQFGRSADVAPQTNTLFSRP